MIRRPMRIVMFLGLVLGGLAAAITGLVLAASPAGAAELCGPDSLGAISFSVDGADPIDDLAALGPLSPGAVVTMSWDATPDGCGDVMVTIAAHRVDASPTSEVNQAEVCTIEDCEGALTFVVPQRSGVCRGELVAAVGPPQLDRNFYGDGEIAAAVIDSGDCADPAPAASIVVLCNQGGVGVSLTNTGDLDAVLTVRINDVNVGQFEVGSRERFEVFALDEDTPTSVAVLAGDVVVHERFLTIDCYEPPTAEILGPDCVAGGASVVFDNPTPTSITYRVTVDGASTEVTVESFRIERIGVQIVEDSEREIVVQAADAAELARATVQRDCERPRATVAADCATNSVVFTLANDGQRSAVVELVVDGAVMVSIPVPGGDQVVARLDLIEDQLTDVAARSMGIELVARQVLLDCHTSPPVSATPPPQVLGVSATSNSAASPLRVSGTLPATGSEVYALVVVAGLLLTLGGFFLTCSAGVAHE